MQFVCQLANKHKNQQSTAIVESHFWDGNSCCKQLLVQNISLCTLWAEFSGNGTLDESNLLLAEMLTQVFNSLILTLICMCLQVSFSVLATACTSSCIFLDMAFQKCFALAFFLRLRASDWHKATQLVSCPRWEKSQGFLNSSLMF